MCKMNLNELNNQINTMVPKTAARRGDFSKYASKAGFRKEAENVSQKVRDLIANEVTRTFSFEVHESGKVLAVTLYFSGKDVPQKDRYKHLAVDAFDEDNLLFDIFDSIKEAKQKCRKVYAEKTSGSSGGKVEEPKTGPVVKRGEQRTVDIVNKVEAEEEAKRAAAAKKPAAKRATAAKGNK